MSSKRECSSNTADAFEVGLEESVDPRVQVELERLNAATDLINKLEIELDEARANFRLLLSDSSQQINSLSKKLGQCVEKARPYYEARMHAKELQAEIQRTALRYERASSAHAAAKEMVHLAEEGLEKRGNCFDSAWQEMLNHATMKVNEAENERALSEVEHQRTSLAYNEAEQVVQQLHQDLKRAIVKSSLSTRRSLLQLNNLANQHQLQLLPYFEMKAQFNEMLKQQRSKVHRLEENVLKVKMGYADALHNLEEISEEIHAKRRLREFTEKNSEECESKFPSLSNGVRLSYHGTTSKESNQASQADNLPTDGSFIDPMSMVDNYLRLPDKMSPKVLLLSKNRISLDGEPHSKEQPSEYEAGNLPSLESSLPSSKTFPILSGQFKNSKAYADTETSADHISYKISSSYSIDKNIVKETDDIAPESNTHVDNLLESCPDQAVDEELCRRDSVDILLGSEAKNYSFCTEITQVFDQSNKSSENNEACDQKTQVSDMNMLRVQKEDLSDTESLGSTDTADTLDDHQIECLLLEKSLIQEYQDLLNVSEDDRPPSN